MTSSISPDNRRRAVVVLAKGFSLVELLVVIGIIAVLAGILLPMLGNAWRSAERAAIAVSLQGIDVALGEYKNDFGDYPRLLSVPTPAGTGAVPNVYGAQLLCWALIGPGSPTLSNGNDGADGPGFRLRAQFGGSPLKLISGGRVYGPYLSVDKYKYKIINAGSTNLCEAAIVDANDNAILYFPGVPVKPDITAAGMYVASSTNKRSLYDSTDNLGYVYGPDGLAVFKWKNDPADATLPYKRMMAMLGSCLNPGQISPGETAAWTGPYILWSAGPDGNFGPQDPTSAADRAACDDVTSFKQ